MLLAADVTLVTSLTTLVAALGGVVVGGIVTYALEAWRRKGEARAGARLLRDDLLRNHYALRVMIEDHSVQVVDPLPSEAWVEFRGVLARHLDHDQFMTVARGAGLAHRFNRLVAQVASDGDAWVDIPDDEVMKGLKALQDDLSAAYGTLGRLAKEKSPTTLGDSDTRA